MLANHVANNAVILRADISGPEIRPLVIVHPPDGLPITSGRVVGPDLMILSIVILPAMTSFRNATRPAPYKPAIVMVEKGIYHELGEKKQSLAENDTFCKALLKNKRGDLT